VDEDRRLLTTEQVQWHFGVGRPRIWKAVNAGQLRVFKHHKGRIFYSVSELLNLWPVLRPLPTELIEEFVRIDEVVRDLALERGISEDEARAIIEADIRDDA
jgi:hypothetical protein